MQYSGNDVFPASFELVNDGTGRDAASVDVGLEALADRTTFLRNVGFRRVRYWIYNSENATPVWVFNSTTYAPNVTDSAAWVVDMEDTRVGDLITIDASVPVVAPGGVTAAFVRVGVTHNALGGGIETLVPGFGRIGGGSSGVVPLISQAPVSAAGISRFRLLGRYTGQGPSFTVVGFGVLRVTLFRPTGSSA